MSVPGCPHEFFCESGDFVIHHKPLFEIVSVIPAKLIAFLNKQFQLGIHLGELSFADRLYGDGL